MDAIIRICQEILCVPYEEFLICKCKFIDLSQFMNKFILHGVKNYLL